MLGYLVIISAFAAVLACYGCALFAFVHLVIVRDADPGERVQLGIVAFVMAVAGITLHFVVDNFAGYLL